MLITFGCDVTSPLPLNGGNKEWPPPPQYFVLTLSFGGLLVCMSAAAAVAFLSVHYLAWINSQFRCLYWKDLIVLDENS